MPWILLILYLNHNPSLITWISWKTDLPWNFYFQIAIIFLFCFGFLLMFFYRLSLICSKKKFGFFADFAFTAWPTKLFFFLVFDVFWVTSPSCTQTSHTNQPLNSFLLAFKCCIYTLQTRIWNFSEWSRRILQIRRQQMNTFYFSMTLFCV